MLAGFLRLPFIIVSGAYDSVVPIGAQKLSDHAWAVSTKRVAQPAMQRVEGDAGVFLARQHEKRTAVFLWVALGALA
jgi:hypothetical protein